MPEEATAKAPFDTVTLEIKRLANTQRPTTRRIDGVGATRLTDEALMELRRHASQERLVIRPGSIKTEWTLNVTAEAFSYAEANRDLPEPLPLEEFVACVESLPPSETMMVLNRLRADALPATMRCPGCGKEVAQRTEGHINPHWVDDAYTCTGEAF